MLFDRRVGGIFLPVSSFPSEYGIGDLLGCSRKVLDWIKSCGFKYQQVFPVNPTGYGDCPYAPTSVHGGNPNFIGFDNFVRDGLISEIELEQLRGCPRDRIDYGKIIPLKLSILQLAYERWKDNASANEKTRFKEFCSSHSWLRKFAIFVAQKRLEPCAWWDWTNKALRDCHEEALVAFEDAHPEEVLFEKWTQWVFYSQWFDLKEYANSNGIKLIGDAPLYVACDSVDAWAYRDILSSEIAGVPPDRHQASTGQLWGNPVYAWEQNLEAVMNWWIQRLEWLVVVYDLVRLDHFRGLIEAWACPAGSTNAANGRWVNVPGYDLLRRVQVQLNGKMPFIAEDLGEMSECQARKLTDLRRAFQIPGIALTAIYGFDGNHDNPFHPDTLARYPAWDKVAVSSTHDDNTAHGWWWEYASPDVRERINGHYRHLTHQDIQKPGWAICEIVARCSSDLVILRWQDLFELPSNFRDNLPGVATGNWTTRMPDQILSKDSAERIHNLLQYTGRV